MAFGGGFTTIPLIQREVVDRYQWITTREFIDGIAMGQIRLAPSSSPRLSWLPSGGLLGALLGTIAVFFPSFVIVMTLARTTTGSSAPIRPDHGARHSRAFMACCSSSSTASGRRPSRTGAPGPHGRRLDRPLAESRLALGGWGGCRRVVAALVSPHTTTGRKASRGDRRGLTVVH